MFTNTKESLPTLLGLMAIVLWGTTIPVSRHAAEQIGPFTSAAVVYLASGAFGCLWLLATGQLGRVVSGASRKYLFGCGGLMVAYTVLLYVAIGYAERSAVVAVTVANYLWPGLTLAFSVPVLGNKARGWLLAAGIGISTAGVWLAVGGNRAEGWPAAGPIVAALAAAVAWGLYSNLARRWTAEAGSGMPLFLLATGIGMLFVRWFVPERCEWNTAAVLELGYIAVFPTLLAYTFWDIAMRKGHMALVAAASYATPILSVGISSLYLGLPISPLQWLAGVLVVLGACGCRLSVRENGERSPKEGSS